MSSSHDYNLASEPDLKPNASRHVWLYFVILGGLLYATIYALDVFYKFTLSNEEEEKIGDISTQEAVEQKALSEAYLSGKKGLFPDKKFVAIGDAMNKFLKDVHSL